MGSCGGRSRPQRVPLSLHLIAFEIYEETEGSKSSNSSSVIAAIRTRSPRQLRRALPASRVP